MRSRRPLKRARCGDVPMTPARIGSRLATHANELRLDSSVNRGRGPAAWAGRAQFHQDEVRARARAAVAPVRGWAAWVGETGRWARGGNARRRASGKVESGM